MLVDTTCSRPLPICSSSSFGILDPLVEIGCLELSWLGVHIRLVGREPGVGYSVSIVSG